MRPFVSILTTVMLALTFVQAPFQHFHEHEENDRHPHGFIHTHLHHVHRASSKTEISSIDPDDDAVFQSWYAQVSHDLIVPALLLASIWDFSAAERSEPYFDRAISGGHDPPLLALSYPRGPPV